MYIDFLSKQVQAPIRNEWMTPEQKSLIDFMHKYNDLCGELQMYFNGQNTNQFSTMNANIETLQSEMCNIEQYLDYLANISNKLLNRTEQQQYSYYTHPIKDEFGNITDSIPGPIQDDLLKIDSNGNIWVEGKITTSATKIGNVFKKLAESFKENVPISKIEDLNL